MSDDLAAPTRPAARREVTEAPRFDDVYRSEYHRVLGVVAAITADRAVAEDVTQEAFLTARDRWATVGRLERPDLWLRRVAINRALSWRRRLGAETRALTRIGARRTPFGGTAGADPTADNGSAASADVWRFVRRLPRRQAALVALVYMGDLTVEQAASALGIGVPTAKTHLQRARRTLADRLTGAGWPTTIDDPTVVDGPDEPTRSTNRDGGTDVDR